MRLLEDGAYIHWPDLDEDLTIAGLLAGRPFGESPQLLKKWPDARKAKQKPRKSGSARAT